MALRDITALPAWESLRAQHADLTGRHLRELFAADPGRAERMSLTAGDLYLDYSKHWVTAETVECLVRLAEEAGLRKRIDAMFNGDRVNLTEDRPALHVALRLPAGAELVVDGQDVVGDVHAVLRRMGDFTGRVRTKQWRGATGEPVATVVNIGIGGSDLGPAMAYEALRDYADAGIDVQFVSNVDPADLRNALAGLDPAATLFVISSKSFDTLETVANATAARKWLTNALGEAAVSRHFVAASTNVAKAERFGIDPANVFGIWSWAGGRLSFCGSVGLSLMTAIGAERFHELLNGFHTIDEHFRTAPFRQNMPVLMGLLGIWYTNFFDAQTRAILPYSRRLHRLPAYLQQLMMESNGKSVRGDGTPVRLNTGEVFWGEPGTNGQHAFFQLLHQGTRTIPADFIGFAEPYADLGNMHDLLFANMLAQVWTLAFGKSAEENSEEGVPAALVPHKVVPGNRPLSVILAPRLTPSTLGQLVALYEHVMFVQGALWDIDSFDQWGVELGKEKALDLLPALTSEASHAGHVDEVVRALVGVYRLLRGRASGPGEVPGVRAGSTAASCRGFGVR
ncbi:glucose-6-phosphate isomerase [Actinomadura sp. ATCC 31491]|uniref:Glucose-6-phosphate isomerase n=1 Tax=Actinomadura luzonensis TaxID=2805427 RepID=A0ABT0FKA5_9ACTN|nr:glucose-6-phosphate isomerase [Actinomadura luzonensis]MCK2212383.1 glucose-6-phosphate isomerase [Actinomadura luzonensis]